MISKNSNDLSPKLLSATKLALVVLILSAAGLFLYFFQPNWFKINLDQATIIATTTELTTATSTVDTCPDCIRRQLDGVLVKPELAKLRPYAVMIDNFISARPQSGLSAASLVYEAPVEGGVTRYLAVFSPDMAPSEIGPIRSARPYFVNWAAELGATYVHVGGSNDALDLAKNLGKSDLNEFYKGSYFWRADNRTAPHDVLTSSDNLSKYRIDVSETGDELTPWQFKDAATSTSDLSSKINLKYSPGYNVSWQYDATSGNYIRYLDDKAHVDANGTAITAKNIIVHLTSFKVLDDKLRLQMSTALSGQALLCQEAVCQMGVWKKNSPSHRAKYYYKNGDEFIFDAGNTWIEVMENLQNVNY